MFNVYDSWLARAIGLPRRVQWLQYARRCCQRCRLRACDRYIGLGARGIYLRPMGVVYRYWGKLGGEQHEQLILEEGGQGGYDEGCAFHDGC
jgi:hypothetical protein